MTTWSPQQAGGLDKVVRWLRTPTHQRQQVFHLFGYAGTGKTTLALTIADIARQELGGSVLFGAFTGKAAQVMQSKGCVGASTIHSLIYKVEPGTIPPVLIRNHESPLKKAALLIVDECSMLGEDLGKDLVSFKTPILVLGDPFQLPPIKGAAFFDTPKPEVMLTEIHRQAQDNPIIRMSMEIRDGMALQIGKYGKSQVRPKASLPEDAMLRADQVLCGLNRTRWTQNHEVRRMLDFPDPVPYETEKVICLRNNRENGLLNGGLWTVKHRNGDERDESVILDLESSDDGRTFKGEAITALFTDKKPEVPVWQQRAHAHFDFGYVITAHKAQGSQWPNVLIYNEGWVFKEDQQRWLYTAVTRASENVVVAI